MSLKRLALAAVALLLALGVVHLALFYVGDPVEVLHERLEELGWQRSELELRDLRQEHSFLARRVDARFAVAAGAVQGTLEASIGKPSHVQPWGPIEVSFAPAHVEPADEPAPSTPADG
jgi:hypothetical protein